MDLPYGMLYHDGSMFSYMFEARKLINSQSNLHICLELEDVFSKFESRAPTNSDLTESDNIEVISITPPGFCWDPTSCHYGENDL